MEGNVDLDQAAVAAVRQWEFTPTILNCIPVEVDMDVSVIVHGPVIRGEGGDNTSARGHWSVRSHRIGKATSQTSSAGPAAAKSAK